MEDRRPSIRSEKYKKWRKEVYIRDGFKCKMCSSARKIQAHHIIRWADCVETRYEVGNGITLCMKCHKKVTGKENEYAHYLKSLISCYDSIDIQQMIRRTKLEDENE